MSVPCGTGPQAAISPTCYCHLFSSPVTFTTIIPQSNLFFYTTSKYVSSEQCFATKNIVTRARASYTRLGVHVTVSSHIPTHVTLPARPPRPPSPPMLVCPGPIVHSFGLTTNYHGRMRKTGNPKGYAGLPERIERFREGAAVVLRNWAPNDTC